MVQARNPALRGHALRYAPSSGIKCGPTAVGRRHPRPHRCRDYRAVAATRRQRVASGDLVEVRTGEVIQRGEPNARGRGRRHSQSARKVQLGGDCTLLAMRSDIAITSRMPSEKTIREGWFNRLIT